MVRKLILLPASRRHFESQYLEIKHSFFRIRESNVYRDTLVSGHMYCSMYISVYLIIYISSSISHHQQHRVISISKTLYDLKITNLYKDFLSTDPRLVRMCVYVCVHAQYFKFMSHLFRAHVL